jgi:hypothetical protein
MRVDTMQPARSSETFKIGGDTPVVRLGYGAIRITGPGIWVPWSPVGTGELARPDGPLARWRKRWASPPHGSPWRGSCGDRP